MHSPFNGFLMFFTTYFWQKSRRLHKIGNRETCLLKKLMDRDLVFIAYLINQACWFPPFTN